MKRIATIESGFARDTQIFAGDPAITKTEADWANNYSHEFFDVKYPCHFIGIFEGADEDEIRNKAAAAQGVYPDVISLTEIDPERSVVVKEIIPEIGMTVYLRPTFSNRDKTILEGTLTKIGRKYYMVESYYQTYKFDIEDKTEISDYSANYSLHFSREDVDIEIERDDLIRKLSNYFHTAASQGCSQTLEQLRKIAVITGGV